MADTCVNKGSCGTDVPLWLNGTHPTVQDEVVTRSICGTNGINCCYYRSTPIRVKACPGGYYVYEFVKPFLCHSAYCAAPDIFYPFGSSAGDTINRVTDDDGGSSVIALLSPFLFFGRTYQQIYVNNNGLLTFNQYSSEFVPYLFPANGSQDIIAGLWTDLDNRQRGVISRNQYTNGSVLTRATQDINNYFPNLNFTASWVFVATWNKVAYYALTNTEASFQVVLISDSNYSFILMNYGNIAATVFPVEAGYDTINSANYFVIPGSDSGSSIANLNTSSNVNVPGRWAFRVDGGPETNTNVPFDPCYKYTVLDDPLRSTDNRELILIEHDYFISWFGWYRLFINGHSVQMPDTCVDMNSCGTAAPLWLSGGHPSVQDGVVTRSVSGSYNSNCYLYQSNPIKVKACPGGYYVYEFVKPMFFITAYCAGSGIFYTFGSAAGDSLNPASDDGSSSVFTLLSPFQFFGRTYQQIYVNNNGFLTFSQASSQYAPDSFPAYGNQDVIAGLWTDLDNSVRGVISYHQYTNGSVLTRATQDINNYFPNLNFTASWVFVVTWNKVSYFSLISTETSFQVVLISGSNYSFILMDYGDIAETGHLVEAGFDTINSTNYFVIPGSDSGSSISNLKNSSNVNVKGRWAFRVDSGPNAETNPSYDPCNNYTVLNDSWRSTKNAYNSSLLYCDQDVNWFGWYRLFINGQSAQMPDTCVAMYSCGAQGPLWLSGGHPTVEDGVVTRDVCARDTSCCNVKARQIRVKACPGGFYVYELVKPSIGCYNTYCADVANITATPATTLAAPGIFYTFGSTAGDTINPAVDDGSSTVITLLSSFLFFGRTYQQIYVNNNGHLTFSQASSQYVPYSFPAYEGQDIIAGLWTDLDNRARGVVSYHQYTNGSVLTRATQDINNYFPNLNFTASWVFVATWDKVAYFSLTNTETSFQVVLISGSNYTFILMNYGDIAVTRHRVEAGYDTVTSTNYFVIPGSINGSSISNLNTSSNVGVQGRWAFRVDSGPRSNILKKVVGLQVRFSSFLDFTQSGNTDNVLQQVKQQLVRYGLPNNITLKLRKVQKINL
ncbi:uncharacterized protein LOC130238120 [Danio aesculapii]|uniref:uncharacterized protein LOC130238120 n=1 Tax=Danio aesculapii TaxID=1142201 RepID=UPI0024C0467E|nr:uncharacterized protein LOC130238120 [Danio aesculapii]